MSEKKWRDDSGFCEWLASAEYVERKKHKIKNVISEGLAIYMWEAWKASREGMTSDDRRHDTED